MTTKKAMQGVAFASDYDGTLCESNWETGEERFDPRDLEAIRRFREAGGLFGICTGRPLFSVQESLRGILDLDFYIVTTGAQVLGRDCEPLFERTIDRRVATELYERYGTEENTVFLAVTDTLTSVGKPFGVGDGKLPVAASLDEIPGDLLGVSLEMHGHEDLAHEACADLNARYGDTVAGFQNLGSVDVVPAGCSKGEGVRIARKKLGVRLMAGMGDSFNDLPLLEAADVAYTFPKAPVEVQRASTKVLGSIAEAIADLGN